MRFIPKANTWRKSVLLYRSIRYRKGFGVHSPFVFDLITKVIEEKCPYYSFQDIELLRKKMLFCTDQITYADRQNRNKLRSRTLGEIVRSGWSTISRVRTFCSWDLRWGFRRST